MTIRLFKLVNAEGFTSEIVSYLGWDYYNKNYSNLKDGTIINPVTYTPTITKSEFKRYFEEVTDTEGQEDFIPTLNELCEVSRVDDLKEWYKFIPRAKYTPHYTNSECYIGDIQSKDVSWKVDQINVEHFVFRPIIKKTWQEQLCEEFGMCYVEKDDNFVQIGTHNTGDMIKMAKRILELSEGEK